MKFKLAYLFYVIPVAVLGFLFYKNTNSYLELEYKFDKKQPILSQLVPILRVEETNISAKIKEEPVYFDVWLARKYDTAEVEIEYSDLNNDIFEIGVARDQARKKFEFVSLENKVFDALGWKKIEANGLSLYQRKKKYKNFHEFFEAPPKFFNTLIYKAEAVPKTSDFLAKGKTKFNFPIQEKIKFVFYHDGGEINFTFDDFAARLYRNNKPINFVDNNNLKEGVYVAEIVGKKESVLNDWAIDSPYIAILDNLKIGELEKPLTIYMAGSRLLARTDKNNGTQKISARALSWSKNSKILNVEDIFKQYKLIFNNNEIKKIVIPKGNIELSGSLFFLNPYRVFYPRYEVFYDGANLDDIDYILTRYNSPTEKNGIKKNKAVFDISNTPTPYRKLRFSLSFPGAISSLGSTSTPFSEAKPFIEIRSIKIKLTGKSFGIKKIFEKMYDYFSIK